ncbi:hypothetical protein EV359DRAFT_8462, partial [Lentinula novae-zelandiae]
DSADGPMDMGEDSDSELQGEELVKSLEEKEARIKSTFAQLMRDKSKQEWKQAEHSSHMGVYNGHSDRTRRYRAQKATEKEKKDATMRNMY